MDKKYENRRNNTKVLLKQVSARKDFLEKVQMNSPQLSHLIGPNFKDNMGSKIAARIETAFTKPPGWLDIDHTDKSVNLDNIDIDTAIHCVLTVNSVLIQNGMALTDIDTLAYSKLLRHTILHASPSGHVSTDQVESSLALMGLSITTE